MLTEAVEGRSVWKGSDFATDSAYVIRLSDAALAELQTAMRLIEDRNLELFRISRDDFPLPGFAQDLKAVSEELENGRGFVQIKGLPIERYTLQQAKTIYWGIGTHLGQAISQNARGHLLGDVRDEGVDIGSPGVRGYQTTAASPFHTDECDVVGLLCWRPAKSGGESLLVSSMALYNELLRRYPWYLGVLYERFSYDWRGEQPKGHPAIYRWPVFEFNQGRLSCRYARRMIEFAQKTTGVMLTEVQRDAFDALDRLIDELKLSIDFEPGDMQFLNNYTILHSRTAFVDHSEPSRKRHLLRLWLTVPNRRPLSPQTIGERDVREGVPLATVSG
jgi:hypothetical protein